MSTENTQKVRIEIKNFESNMDTESIETLIPAGGENRLDYLQKHLPGILLKGMNTYKTEDEKLLYLFETLAGASGLLTNVTSVYRDRAIGANLYCAGIARPASGKGLIDDVQLQFYRVHQHFLERSELLQRQYKEDLRNYHKVKKVDPDALMPKAPPFQIVFIPANITSAKLLKHLQENQATEIVPQILIDSEIDSLVGSLESDLSIISSILRKAFHGETISMSRKTDNEYIEIRNCQMALALTGTVNQFIKLVNNRSDGLVSRFLVYIIKSAPKVTGIRRCPTCPDVKQTFAHLANDYFSFWKFMQEESFEVELTDDQLEILEAYLDNKLKESISVYGDEAAQIILRHGVMAAKICMILASLRKFEYAERISKVACDDEDFTVALKLIEISIGHSLQFFEMLPDANYNRKSGHKASFLQKLPRDFSRKEALEACGGSVSDRTLDRWLNSFLKDGLITQVASGQYRQS